MHKMLKWHCSVLCLFHKDIQAKPIWTMAFQRRLVLKMANGQITPKFDAATLNFFFLDELERPEGGWLHGGGLCCAWLENRKERGALFVLGEETVHDFKHRLASWQSTRWVAFLFRIPRWLLLQRKSCWRHVMLNPESWDWVCIRMSSYILDGILTVQ